MGEHLVCEREPTNVNDRFAVAIVKHNVIVDHIPRAQSKIYSLFLLRNGTIDCIVIGSRRYSADLPQGVLEVLCKLPLNGKHDKIKKLKHYWQGRL